MSQFPGDFSPEVTQLISLGEAPTRMPSRFDYTELGITAEHIPELLRILDEIDLFWPEGEMETAELYAPIHAWRALGQLKTPEAIEPLIRLVDKNEELDTDWVMEEIPEVMGMIGPACIPALRAYLLSPKRKIWACVTLSNCLEEIASRYPESHTNCVAALLAGLEQYADNDEIINAYLILHLANLKAVEAAPLVERAYQADQVDLSVLGDYEDFEVAAGLLKERLTAPIRYHSILNPQTEWEHDKKTRREAERRQRQQAQKEKKKRKQAQKNRRGKKRKRK